MTPPKNTTALDTLTELPRLPALLGRIREHLSRRGRVGLLSLHIVRPDDFERRHGAEALDRLIVQASRFLKNFTERAMRHDDEALEVMIQGNTFVVIVGPPRERQEIGLIDLGGARDRLETALREFLSGLLPEGAPAPPFSCGCAMVEDAPDADRVDRRVYAALDDALADALRRTRGGADGEVALLRHVLDDHALLTVYQPVLDIVVPGVVGFEALSRTATDPPVPPGRLFRLALEHDALWRLERLARERAIENARPLTPQQLLFLNVDPEALEDPLLRGPETLARLRDVGLTPGRVVLELTEQRAAALGAPLRRVLEGFRRMGFRLALDDVGAGYAGLSTIAEVHPDFLKLDMSLVRNLDQTTLKRGLVATIQEFSHRANIPLVAEGVERPEELRELRSLGVRLAQGHLLAKPQPAPQIPDLDSLAGPRACGGEEPRPQRRDRATMAPSDRR